MNISLFEWDKVRGELLRAEGRAKVKLVRIYKECAPDVHSDNDDQVLFKK